MMGRAVEEEHSADAVLCRISNYWGEIKERTAAQCCIAEEEVAFFVFRRRRRKFHPERVVEKYIE